MATRVWKHPTGSVVEKDADRACFPRDESRDPFPLAKLRCRREANGVGADTKRESSTCSVPFGEAERMAEELREKISSKHLRMFESRASKRDSDAPEVSMTIDKARGERGGPSTWRFDAHGELQLNIISDLDWNEETGSEDARITGSVTRDILRWSMDPSGHTYTLVELSHLMRSSVRQQRVLSLRILSRVIELAHPTTRSNVPPHDGSWVELWTYLLRDMEMVELLRLTLDDEHPSVVTAAAQCIATLVCPHKEDLMLDRVERIGSNSCFTPLAPMQRALPGSPWTANYHEASQEARANVGGTESLALLDPLAALVKKNLLPRVRYLLHVYKATGSDRFLMRILRAVARHSATFCDAVVSCPFMIECLQELEGSCEDPNTREDVLYLIKLLCRGSVQCSQKLYHAGLLPCLLKYIIPGTSCGSALYASVYEMWDYAVAADLQLFDNQHLFTLVQRDIIVTTRDGSPQQLHASARLFSLLQHMFSKVPAGSVLSEEFQKSMGLAAEYACSWLSKDDILTVIDSEAHTQPLIALSCACRFLAAFLRDFSTSFSEKLQHDQFLLEKARHVRNILKESIPQISGHENRNLEYLLGLALRKEPGSLAPHEMESLSECSAAASSCLAALFSLFHVLDVCCSCQEFLERVIQGSLATSAISASNCSQMVQWTPALAVYEHMRHHHINLASTALEALTYVEKQILERQGEAIDSPGMQRRMKSQALISSLLCCLRPGEDSHAEALMRTFCSPSSLGHVLEYGWSSITDFVELEGSAVQLGLQSTCLGAEPPVHRFPIQCSPSIARLLEMSENLLEIYSSLHLNHHSFSGTCMLPAEGSHLPLGPAWFLEPLQFIDDIYMKKNSSNSAIEENEVCALLLLQYFLEKAMGSSLQVVQPSEKLLYLAHVFMSEHDLYRTESVRTALALLIDLYTTSGLAQYQSTGHLGGLQHTLELEDGTTLQQTTLPRCWLAANHLAALCENFCACSFGDELFGRLLAFHLKRDAPVYLRLTVWQILINNRSLHLMPKLSSCSGESSSYLALSDVLKNGDWFDETLQQELKLMELFADVLGAVSLYKIPIGEPESAVSAWIAIYQLTAFLFGLDCKPAGKEPSDNQRASAILHSRQRMIRQALHDWDDGTLRAVLQFPDIPSYQPSKDFDIAGMVPKRKVAVDSRRDTLVQACAGNTFLLERLSMLTV